MLTLFTRDDCPACGELKALLRQAGVRFDTVDVDTVDGMAAYSDARGGTSELPLLKNIDGRTFAGQRAIDFVRHTMTED